MARVCLGGGRGGLEIMVGPQCNNADAIIGDPQCDNANEDIGAACVKTSKKVRFSKTCPSGLCVLGGGRVGQEIMAGPECNNADEDERGQAIRNATMQRRTSARHVCKRRRGHRRGMCENVDAITEVPQRNNAEELIGGPRGRGSWAIIGVPPCTAWKQSSRMSNARGVEANRRGCVEEVGVVVIVVEVIIVVVGAVGMNRLGTF
eukprot:CAMPEP_0180089268 /NCGR_PEP_ID=MMETSP0985-20121206/22708_1 /TAXON_ID=483367 /ORGANISM="non described non described, Strain CCMP 2436" /LENGTH=204 /DNA_ID=CAMNT_0022023793 /DNA_START=152 /DNA_END=767 /DNA_ORIENTATION=+